MAWGLREIVFGVAGAAFALIVGAGGVAANAEPPKELAPIPGRTLAAMKARDTAAGAPILIRTFKKEAELEVWKQARDGRFVLLKTFPVCRWSGQLGPKRTQGDRQTPEGFYSVGPRQMNPNSAHYLSFNIGFPNEYDKAQGATGAFLMVHGTCSSAGCYAMTDDGIREIYAIAREAFAGGQKAFQFQAFPFRMTAENLARHRTDPNIDFWRQLKEGSDRFEATGREPIVTVSSGKYAFKPFKDAATEALAAARITDERARFASLVKEGIGAVRTTYEDGGLHPSFLALVRRSAPSLGMVSRPEALAAAGREIVVIRGRRKQPACTSESCSTQWAKLEDPAGSAQPSGLEDGPLKPAILAPDATPLASWPIISGAAQILSVPLTPTPADLGSNS